MKKINIFFIISLMFIFLTFSVSAYEVDINIIDVQTTDILFIFEDEEINDKNIDFTIENITYYKENNKKIIKLTIPNNNLKDSFSAVFDKMLSVLEIDNKEIVENIKNKNISVSASFFGYPFGGIVNANINAENVENPIDVSINSTYSLNNQNFVSKGVINPSDFPAYIEFGINTIDTLKITIEPQSNYKTVIVTFDMYSKSGKLNDMSSDDLAKYGYNVISQSSNNLVASYTYHDIDGFNYIFNNDLVKIFNIVGFVELETSKSIMNNMKFTGNFVESESVKDVQLKIVMPDTATDSESQTTSKSFLYDLSVPIKMNITINKINLLTLLVLIIVPIAIGFVLFAFFMLNKKQNKMY